MNDRRTLLQDALGAIERLEDRLAASERALHQPIAIIGAGCRFPGGANDPQALWRIVRDGIDAVGEVPDGRWDAAAYHDPSGRHPGKMVSRRGGFLHGLEQFDPQFFGISAREAVTLDPQQRMLLETAYEAMETAGLAVDRLSGSQTGVFVGISNTEYAQLTGQLGLETADPYSANGGALNAAAGRLSFVFGFNGPAVAVDTACSSSLVAIHLACQSLRTGETSLALAGGVNTILKPDGMVLFSKWGLMAKDGQCKVFDAAADGFVRSEGCGVLALKRLSDALDAGDPVLAVIRGSAVNSDGRSSGLTVPHGPAQEAAVRAALASAGLQPADIDYVEAHGTGTPIGDPIELEALAAVLGQERDARCPLLVGSVKANLGHPESAAGIAGVLKTVMALQHEAIPPNRNFHVPNPRIAWDTLPVRVPIALTPWPRGERPRLAGISGFGFSGTNAHIILEEAPPLAPATAERGQRPVLVPLSARSEPALRALAQAHAEALASDPDLQLDDVAATLGSGRAHMPRRLGLLVETRDALAQGLAAIASGNPVPAAATGTRTGERTRFAFLFTGQGAQYPGMGRRLYATEPVFRATIDRATCLLATKLPRPLTDIMFSVDPADAALGETATTQPALFALEYALAELWRSWGIVPGMVAGHSVGEYVAACVAGVFSFEDGLALVAERGRLMQALPPDGAMAAVFAPEAAVVAAISGIAGLAIAAVNGPEETVLSGDAQALARVLARLQGAGIASRALDVSHAFHSPLLDPMLDALEHAAAAVPHAAPRITLVSNLTGTPFPPGIRPDAAYWRRHARDAVRFTDCVATLHASGATALVEVGPHPTLLALAARAVPDANWAAIPSLRRGRDERTEMLSGLRSLYVQGAEIRWNALAAPGARRVALPTYRFQRERYWIDTSPAHPRSAIAGGHPLLGERQISPAGPAQFLAELGRDRPGLLADHEVFGTVLMPGTGYVEMGLAACRAMGMAGAIGVQQVGIAEQLDFPADTLKWVHTAVSPDPAGRLRVAIRSASADSSGGPAWREHARLMLRHGGAEFANACPTFADAGARCTEPVDITGFYPRLAQAGLHYGPSFRCVHASRRGTRIATGVLELPQEAGQGFVLHPGLLDAAFQVLDAATMSDTDDVPGTVYVPVGINEVTVLMDGPSRLHVVATVLERSATGFARADLRLEDESGRLAALVSGLQLKSVTMDTLGRAGSASRIRTHVLERHWRPVRGTSTLPGDGTYLLLGDRTGVAGNLADALTGGGAHCTVLEAPAGLAAALARPPDWVIDCRPLAVPPADSGPSAQTAAAYMALLSVAQALGVLAPRAGLCLLTRGAQAVAPGDDVALPQAALLGLMRTLGAEQAGPRLCIDLDPAIPADPRSLLAALAVLSPAAPELALRQGEILAGPLQPLSLPAPPAPGLRQVLRIPQRGDLDRLVVEDAPRVSPQGREVEIAIRASGLNFRDVLNALGLYPGDAGPLGSECSGIVTAVGPDVQGLRPGDAVIALAGEALASHVTVADLLVVPKPDSITFAEAVTLPNTYLTAALCLEAFGILRPGAKVLVHAAAGGVGLAALRLARLAGLEVFGTAGSAEKRAFVLAQGAAGVFDSRSLSFAEGVMRATDGAGVDLVINALSDEFIPAGMGVLRPGGGFAEIGKKGIWTQEEATARAPHVRYKIVDLGAEIAADIAAVRARFDQVMAEVAAGRLAPLPLQTFPLAQATAAFRFMANARHVGKVVLLPAPDGATVPVRGNGTYLVTGGLGGLGLAMAGWLAGRGAGRIVLLGRRGAGPDHAGALQALRVQGATVLALACDIADPAAVAALWRDVIANGPPLRGVLHAAGVLADAGLAEQDAERFATVARPKVDGAWNLHLASARDPLDFFVLFSSTSALLGSAGQANYAAANAFLDGLAAYRRLRGQVGVSIAWGAWADAGMAAGLSDAAHARWARMGIGQLGTAQALAAMETVLGAGPSGAVITAMDIERLAAQASPGLRALLGTEAAVAAPAPRTNALDALRALAEDAPAARLDLLRRYVHEEAARVLGFNPSALDADTPLSALGFDSLMAVQFRNVIASQLSVDLPLRDLLQGPTIARLTEDLHARFHGNGAIASPEMAWEEGSL